MSKLFGRINIELRTCCSINLFCQQFQLYCSRFRGFFKTFGVNAYPFIFHCCQNLYKREFYVFAKPEQLFFTFQFFAEHIFKLKGKISILAAIVRELSWFNVINTQFCFSRSDKFLKSCCPVSEMMGCHVIKIVLFFRVKHIAGKHGVKSDRREFYAVFFQNENVVFEILTTFQY